MLKILISYARKDGQTIAQKLHRRLERMGYEVWQDVEDLRAGESWQAQLGEAIGAVDVVLVVCTPAAMASKYVEWEWTTGLFVAKKTIIPILGLPATLSPELGRLQYCDMSSPDKEEKGWDDLILALQKIATPATSTGSKYYIEGGENNTIGDNAIGIYGFTADEFNQLRLDKVKRLQQLAAQINQTHSATYQVIGGKNNTIGDNPIGIYAEQERGLEQTIRNLFEIHEQNLMLHMASLIEGKYMETTNQVLQAIDQATIHDKEMQVVLDTLRVEFEALRTTSHGEQVQAVEDLISAPHLDVRHRLKLTIPLLPLFLSYEGELETNSSLNLEGLWQRVTRWIK